MSCRIAVIAIDAVELRVVADFFWCAILGWQVVAEDRDGVSIAAPDGPWPSIDIFAVPEGKAVKNRLHLDLRADGVTTAGEFERLLALGARPVDVGQDPDVSWVVLSDPEGNEFCLLSTLRGGSATGTPPAALVARGRPGGGAAEAFEAGRSWPTGLRERGSPRCRSAGSAVATAWLWSSSTRVGWTWLVQVGLEQSGVRATATDVGQDGLADAPQSVEDDRLGGARRCRAKRPRDRPLRRALSARPASVRTCRFRSLRPGRTLHSSR